MNADLLRQLLDDVASGKATSAEALSRLKDLPFEEVGGFARVDHHRALRRGFPETIFSEGKTPDQVLEITSRILAKQSVVLATRVDGGLARAMSERFEDAEVDASARTVVVRPPGVEPLPEKGLVLVVSAGTSDIPVARLRSHSVSMGGGLPPAVRMKFSSGSPMPINRFTRSLDTQEKSKTSLSALTAI